jgi:hypothetical protein
MKRVLLVLAAFSLISISCDSIVGEKIKGDGNVVTEARSVGFFESVEAKGALTLVVANTKENKVDVKVDKNLQSHIKVMVENNVLKIRKEEGYNLKPTEKIIVFVTAPGFRALDVSGACDIITEEMLYNPGEMDLNVSGASSINMEMRLPKVKVHLSGSGSVYLKGETQSFKINLSGAADAKCYELLSEYGEIDISGAGTAEVFTSVRLEAKISGAGTVRYKGNPTFVTQHVTGAGKIAKVE